MNTRSRLSRIGLCAVAVLCLGHLYSCATAPSLVRQHEDFATHCASIKRVAVVPPNVQLYLVRLGGLKEGLSGQMPRIAEDLIQVMGDELTRQGFNATAIAPTPGPRPDSDALFREAEISRLYAQISNEISRQPGNTSNGHSIECTLGQEAKSLAMFARSDGLIFVNFTGWKRSGGSVATEMAFKVLLTMAGGYLPQDPIGAGEMQVALVDGRTGEILWTNRVARTRYGFAPPDFDLTELRVMAKDVFEGFPKRPN
ncbi:MAG: hypothetical protein MUF20_13935 [Methylotetracoccus sp.]|nr:hypothetical protein [Methylotetracoccus sp.]